MKPCKAGALTGYDLQLGSNGRLNGPLNWSEWSEAMILIGRYRLQLFSGSLAVARYKVLVVGRSCNYEVVMKSPACVVVVIRRVVSLRTKTGIRQRLTKQEIGAV